MHFQGLSTIRKLTNLTISLGLGGLLVFQYANTLTRDTAFNVAAIDRPCKGINVLTIVRMNKASQFLCLTTQALFTFLGSE